MKSQTMTHTGNHSFSTQHFCVFPLEVKHLCFKGRTPFPNSHIRRPQQVISSPSAGIAISSCLWPAHRMAESYRDQDEEEQTWRPGKMGNMCCKCCSAVLSSSGLCQWQRFGKLITCSWDGAPVKHGWSPTKRLKINGFAWCDHYLCEMLNCWMGPRQWPNGHFPVER